jgi:hypothetical protein
MAVYMHANKVRTELETIVHSVLVVNDGVSRLSLEVVFVVGAAWITPTRWRRMQRSIAKRIIVYHHFEDASCSLFVSYWRASFQGSTHI